MRMFLTMILAIAALIPAYTLGLNKIWEAEYDDQPYAATFDEEAGYVYLAGENGLVFRVDAENGERLMTFENGYCPDLPRGIYIGSNNTIVLLCPASITSWDKATGSLLQSRTFKGNEISFKWLNVGRDNIYFMVASIDNNEASHLVHRWDPRTGEDDVLEMLTKPEKLGEQPVYPLMSNITPSGDFVLYTRSEIASNYDIEGLFLLNTSDLNTRDTIFSKWQQKNFPVEDQKEDEAIMVENLSISPDAKYISLITEMPMPDSKYGKGTAYIYDMEERKIVFEKEYIERNEAMYLLDGGLAVNFCGSHQWPSVRIYEFPNGGELYHSGGLDWRPEYAGNFGIVSRGAKSASLYKYDLSSVKEYLPHPKVWFTAENSALTLRSAVHLDDLTISDLKGRSIYTKDKYKAGGESVVVNGLVRDVYFITYTSAGVVYANKIYVD
jgi:hypothetical protein